MGRADKENYLGLRTDKKVIAREITEEDSGENYMGG